MHSILQPLTPPCSETCSLLLTFYIPKVISELQATWILLAGHGLKFLICSIKQRNAKNCLCKPDFRETLISGETTSTKPGEIAFSHWCSCILAEEKVPLLHPVPDLPDFFFYQIFHPFNNNTERHACSRSALTMAPMDNSQLPR